MIDPFIYTKTDYFKKLIQDIDRCQRGDRILVAAMALDHTDNLVMDLLSSMSRATARKATVTLIIDAYSFLITSHNLPGPLFFNNNIRRYALPVFQERYRLLERLRDQAINICITNLPDKRFSNPVSGRSHAKYAVINDTAYIGGCNLDSNIDHDLMVSYYSPKLADWLSAYAQDLMRNNGISTQHHTNSTYTVDQRTELLFDGGIRGKSIILKNAYDVIDRAKSHIMLTCMLFPDGSVMQHLLKAHERGIKIELLCNHPARLHFPDNVYHYWQMFRHKSSAPSSFYANQLTRNHQFLHAKVLSSENTTIIGSHNFVDVGVKLGTIEIALRYSSEQFANTIQKFMKTMLDL